MEKEPFSYAPHMATTQKSIAVMNNSDTMLWNIPINL